MILLGINITRQRIIKTEKFYRLMYNNNDDK